VGDVVVWQRVGAGATNRLTFGAARVAAAGVVELYAANVRTDATIAADTSGLANVALFKPRAQRLSPSGPPKAEAATTTASLSVTPAANEGTVVGAAQLTGLLGQYGANSVVIWSPIAADLNSQLWYGMANTGPSPRYQVYNVGAALSVTTFVPATVVIPPPAS
jgi:hypothetical protein